MVLEQICQELARMVTAVADFRSFLGPQLKAVSGDAQARSKPFFLEYIKLGPSGLSFSEYQLVAQLWVSE